MFRPGTYGSAATEGPTGVGHAQLHGLCSYASSQWPCFLHPCWLGRELREGFSDQFKLEALPQHGGALSPSGFSASKWRARGAGTAGCPIPESGRCKRTAPPLGRRLHIRVMQGRLTTLAQRVHLAA